MAPRQHPPTDLQTIRSVTIQALTRRRPEWVREVAYALMVADPLLSAWSSKKRAEDLLDAVMSPRSRTHLVLVGHGLGHLEPQATVTLQSAEGRKLRLLFGYDLRDNEWYVLANMGTTTDRERVKRAYREKFPCTTPREPAVIG